MKRIVALSAAAHRPSKTTALVRAVAEGCQLKSGYELALYDFVDTGLEFGATVDRGKTSETVQRILKEVESADGLIVGSPTYKGAYSGHFKHFFDLIDPYALRGKPVCLLATGGGVRHSLMIEQSMRPLFGFFAATTVPTTIYASDADFENYQITAPNVAARIDRVHEEFAALMTLC